MEQKIINCPHCGKIIPKNILNGDLKREIVNCPECGSPRNYKDGLRYTGSFILDRVMKHALKSANLYPLRNYFRNKTEVLVSSWLHLFPMFSLRFVFLILG